MYNLIRFFNQNKKNIIRIILIIVFILLLIQGLNFLAKNNFFKKRYVKKNQYDNVELNENTLISKDSVISGKEVDKAKLKSATDIINLFFDYCNSQNIEAAYDMLTDECKEEMYPSIEEFKRIYYDSLFDDGNKTITIENWFDGTYQVRITGDILSSGKLDGNQTKQDYVTVVEQNNEYKLNINNYVGRVKPKTQTTIYDNVDVTVDKIDTYMDYEIYTISVKNNTKNSILLDTGENTKSIYLLDKNNVKYYFYSNEILKNKLIIQSQYSNSLKIKFASPYSSTKKIKSIVFSRFVSNYDKYKNIDNKEDYSEFELCKVNV